MKVAIEWERPLTLKDGSRHDLIYFIEQEKIPDAPGIYVFGRKWGTNMEALYVGTATNIRNRVKGQFNNLRLMQHLKNAKSGKRIVLFGLVQLKQGQKLDKVILLSEKCFIRHFLAQGHDLVNKHGIKIRRHEISSDGHCPKKFIPSVMFFEKQKK
ncbi:MAG: hypothetical protein AB1742_14700 [bacterium]